MSGVAGLWQEVNNRNTHFHLIGLSPFKPASYPQDGEAEFYPSVCTLSKLSCEVNFAHRSPHSLCASTDCHSTISMLLDSKVSVFVVYKVISLPNAIVLRCMYTKTNQLLACPLLAG